jgi:PKD repeat protein
MKNFKLNALGKVRSIIIILLVFIGYIAQAQVSGINYIDSSATSSYVGNPSGVSGKTWQTFNGAVTALSSYGINSAVTFMVKKGTYNEQVTLPSISGVSAMNTLTFDGGAGNASTRILVYAATAAANSHVFQSNNCSYVTIKNLKFVNNGTSYGCCIHLYGVCNYCNIHRNICTFSKTYGYNSSSANYTAISVCNNASVSGVTMCGSSTATTNNIIIDSNTVLGGGYGITVTTSGSATTMQVLNNTITDNNYFGIYFSSNPGQICDYNVIRARSGTTMYAGICGCNGSTSGNEWYEYIGNQIYGAGSYGIGIWTQNPNGTPRNKMVNNLIDVQSGSAQALKFDYEKNYDVWFNSILMEGSGAPYGVYCCQSASYGNENVQSNNFAFSNSSESGGYGVYCVSAGSGNTYNWNNYYHVNPTSYGAVYDGGTQYNLPLSALRGAGGYNTTCFSQAPNYNSNTDMHYNPLAVPLYGNPALGITIDCDKLTRCPNYPTIGGSESQFGYPKPIVTFTQNVDTIYTKANVTFLNPNSSNGPYFYKWYVNGGLKSSAFNFNTSFITAGTYSVALVGISYCGAKKDSLSQNIIVYKPVRQPTANFSASENIGYTGDTIQLIDQSLNGVNQWNWHVYPDQIYDPNKGVVMPTYFFAKSTNSSTQSPYIIFQYTGTYTVCLRVANNFGYDSTCKSGFINIRQIVNMCNGTTNSNSNYGALFDDGGPKGNSGFSQSCNFLISPCSPNLTLNMISFNMVQGDYLRIYDGYDNTGIKLFDPSIFPLGYTGNMALNPAIPTTFTCTTGKAYIEYVTSTTSPQASGFELDWNALPQVLIKPKASFTVSDTSICKNRLYTFTNTSSGYGNLYLWDFTGSGNYISGVNETYAYNSAGAYTISMIAQNCAGVDTFRKVVTVYSPTVKPKVTFGPDIINPNYNTDIVTIYDSSFRCADTWKWTITPTTYKLVNSTTLNSQNPQVTFTAVGCYTIKLVAGCNGNFDSLTRTNYICALNYCTPVVSNYNKDIGISEVILGSIDNVSGITTQTYTNYTKTQKTLLVKTVKYPITINRITNYNPMSIYVWIDYNRDGNFDNTELATYTNSSSGLSWTGYITVPSTALTGNTRMRVGTNYANLPNLSCGANYYGEFEDYTVNLQSNSTPPIITLKGTSPVYIEAGYKYVDSGAIAMDLLSGNISSSIVVTNGVNTSKPGTYYVTYNVSNISGIQASSVKRTVIVTKDVTFPILVLKGSDTLTLNVYSTYVDPGDSAIDLPWGTNFTKAIKVTGTVNMNKLGKYVLTYTVTDSAQNQTSKTRTIYVVDNMAPTVTLKGNNPDYIAVFKKYTDPGVTVTDNYWKNTVPTITNNLNTNKIGTYQFLYCASDSSGNGPVCITRKVIVYDSTKPVISFNAGQDTMEMEVNTYFSDPGINITDNYYKYLYPVITGTFYADYPIGKPTKLGCYTIIYTVMDSSNNSSFLTRVLCVNDNTPPVINLVGSLIDTVAKSNFINYHDKGYTVSDNYTATNLIKIDTINNFTHSTKPGVFTMQYKATDSSGNVGYSQIRNIWVENIWDGINNSGNLSGFITMYPNPTNGLVTINLNLPTKDAVTINLYDVLGKELKEVYSGYTQTNTINANLQDYTKGVYFVKFTYKDQTHTEILILK